MVRRPLLVEHDGKVKLAQRPQTPAPPPVKPGKSPQCHSFSLIQLDGRLKGIAVSNLGDLGLILRLVLYSGIVTQYFGLYVRPIAASLNTDPRKIQAVFVACLWKTIEYV